MKKEKSKEEFINPIDPDKVAENPSTLPYAHTVGGAVINPDKQSVVRSKSVSAMEQQTDMQLEQIKEQIELLADQAKKIQERVRVSELIYGAKISFKPEINHIYHLYQAEDQSMVLSMIGPNEWGKKCKFEEFIHSVRLLADHTWQIVD